VIALIIYELDIELKMKEERWRVKMKEREMERWKVERRDGERWRDVER
jgi:hypothetical protein